MPSSAFVELEKWREDNDRLRCFHYVDYVDDDRHSSDTTASTSCNVQRRNSFSYVRLPEHLLKLSVLKLDGSSFDIRVAKSASVSELKLAVEEVFSRSPKAGEGDISWSHVWGNFCLCYDNHVLNDDKASLRSFGVKDGDQLHFIRRLSMNHSPPKRRLKGHESTSERHNMSLAESKVHDELLENGREKDDNKHNEHENNGGRSDERYHSGNEENEYLVGHGEFRLAHFLRGWLSYTRLSGTAGRMSSEARARTSRFASYCQRINGTKFPR